ncbi:unnamed protein product, partial [Ectocarpus sp. 6 AP-2014]
MGERTHSCRETMYGGNLCLDEGGEMGWSRLFMLYGSGLATHTFSHFSPKQHCGLERRDAMALIRCTGMHAFQDELSGDAQGEGEGQNTQCLASEFAKDPCWTKIIDAELVRAMDC